MSSNYTRKTDGLYRSFDFAELAGDGNPYQLLASAIIFQAAFDCQSWTPAIEGPCYYTGGSHGGVRLMRKDKLLEFISSDWLEWLLCWQHEISVEAVREELTRRLTS